MKKLFLISLLWGTFVNAQKISVVQLADKQGYVWTPTNYDSTKTYPCMFFIPGSGEMTGPITNLNIHGPFLYLSKGVYPKLDMIIVAVQAASGPQPYINALRAKYKISVIGATGLSLGNQVWMQYAFTGNFSQIGSFFMASGDPEYGAAVRDPSLFGKYNTFYYGACGDQDAFYNMYRVGMFGLYDSIFVHYPTLAAFDVFKGAGHGDPVWSSMYNPVWSSPAMGMSIYQKFVSLSPPVSSPVIVTKPPVTVCPVCPPAIACPVVKQRSVVSESVTYQNGVWTAIYIFDDGSQQNVP